MRTLSGIVFSLLFVLAQQAAASAGPILIVGDSLSAAYGIEKQRGWVALLQQRLRADGFPQAVINASITGDTTRGGLSRLPSSLQRQQPSIVVIALGGNDGLRGFAPEQTRSNLSAMIRLSRESGARVLLLGIQLPANYGRAYGEKFHRIYLDLAAAEQVPLVPFFLEGVAETRALMQADGIHPAAEAQPRILDNVWAELGPMLDTITAAEASDAAPEGVDNEQ
jgi:acyl-CoA thioesterase-1